MINQIQSSDTLSSSLSHSFISFLVLLSHLFIFQFFDYTYKHTHIISTSLCRKSSDTTDPVRSIPTPSSSSSSQIKHDPPPQHQQSDEIRVQFEQLVRRMDDFDRRLKIMENTSTNTNHTSPLFRTDNNDENNFDDDLKF